jgi:hypothetical protein
MVELMSEPHVMGEHEGHSDLQAIVGRHNTDIFEDARVAGATTFGELLDHS